MNRYLLILGVLIGVITILFDGITSYFFLNKLTESIEFRNSIIHDMNKMEYFLSRVKDAETGQRGYVITGKEEYLDPYYKADHYLNSKKLSKFLSSQEQDPYLGDEIKKLHTLIKSKLEELNKTVIIKREKGFDAAQEFILNTSENTKMNEIREIVKKYKEVKHKSLLEKDREIEEIFRFLFKLIIFAHILAFIIIISCIALLNSDIKRRVKAETELNKLQQFQDEILQSASEGILTIDPKGVINSFNKGASSIFDIPAEDAMGKSIDQLLGNKDNKETLNYFSEKYGQPFLTPLDYIKFAAKNNIKEDIPWEASKRSGQPIYLLFSFGSLKDANGEEDGLLLEGTDITERKQWEIKLAAAQHKAEQASLAKSQFMANMSHDLRTPLTSIIGFTEILTQNRSNNLTEKDLNYLSRIEDNGRHLLALIDNILDLEKIEEGKMSITKTSVDLKELISNIANQLDFQFSKKNLILDLEVPENLDPILTDKQKLSQILINLIVNAIKFTEKGFIKVSVIKNEATNVPKKIDVMDTGIGIDPLKLDKIFDAFYQIDPSYNRISPGSGLGLGICRSMCDLLNYKITVKSELGKGTTFSIILDT